MKIHIPVVHDWRRIYRALLKSLLVILVLAVGLFLWVTISFNRLQPSEVERNEAIVLAKEMEKFIGYRDESVFASASRGAVFVSFYGIESTSEQNKIIEKLRELLKMHPFKGNVFVEYFPVRRYTYEESGKARIANLIKDPSIREEKLQ